MIPAACDVLRLLRHAHAAAVRVPPPAQEDAEEGAGGIRRGRCCRWGRHRESPRIGALSGGGHIWSVARPPSNRQRADRRKPHRVRIVAWPASHRCRSDRRQRPARFASASPSPWLSVQNPSPRPPSPGGTISFQGSGIADRRATACLARRRRGRWPWCPAPTTSIWCSMSLGRCPPIGCSVARSST